MSVDIKRLFCVSLFTSQQGRKPQRISSVLRLPTVSHYHPHTLTHSFLSLYIFCFSLQPSRAAKLPEYQPIIKKVFQSGFFTPNNAHVTFQKVTFMMTENCFYIIVMYSLKGRQCRQVAVNLGKEKNVYFVP